jgi:Flp pilus assembly protein TadG
VRRCRRRRDDGAAAVEFALVGGLILIPLVMGIMAFGLYFWSTTQVNHALRDGARTGAVGATCAEWQAVMRSRLAGVNWSSATMGARTTRMQEFTVTVNWTQPVVPVPGVGSLTSAPSLSATTRVERVPTATTACSVAP